MTKDEDMSLQHSNAVRLFSPDELLHIFGFPDSYSFPTNMTTRHKYRAIGQSINKIVVQMLMHSELCRLTTTMEQTRGSETIEKPSTSCPKKRSPEDRNDDVDCLMSSKKLRE